MRQKADGDFVVLTFGGKLFTRHGRAFEAMRECDHLLATGVPAFFMGWLDFESKSRRDRK